MYDIHSHVLFEIDDGAKSLEDAVALCRMAHEDGVHAIVATPHIRRPMWLNDRATIEARLNDLRAELARLGLGIEVVIGAEVYFDPGMVQAVLEGAYPTYADGRRYVLFELPNYFLARQVQEMVFDFRTSGLIPVLAHPERNEHLMKNQDSLRELVRMGTLLQVTAMSINGKFGRAARRGADLLLDENLAHVVASDAHSRRFRPALLSEARQRVAARYGEERARRLFVDNPRCIIEGSELDPVANEPMPPRSALRRLLARVF